MNFSSLKSSISASNIFALGVFASTLLWNISPAKADVMINWNLGNVGNGAVYLNICSDGFNNVTPSGGCRNINIHNAQVSARGSKRIQTTPTGIYRACIVADNLPNRPGRWIDCKIVGSAPHGDPGEELYISSYRFLSSSLNFWRRNP